MYIFGYFFQKRHFKGIWEKGHIDKKRWGGGGGGGGGGPPPPPPPAGGGGGGGGGWLATPLPLPAPEGMLNMHSHFIGGTTSQNRMK